MNKILKTRKNLDRYSLSFFFTLQEFFPIDEKSLRVYNDIAYYLYQAKKYKASEALLSDILQLYPDRVVAHLNMGDALLAMNKTQEAKPYHLSYMAQMVKSGKEKKIPKELLMRYGDELDIIRTLEKSIKENYQILDIAQGEINKDSHKDSVVVLSYVDRVKIEHQEFGKPSNTNNRVLLVLWGTKEGFKVHTQNNQAIYPDDVPNCDDSFNGIEIKDKSLYIAYRYWCSAGGWSQGEETYQFIYRDNKMVLAGLESWNNSRASGEGKEVSANFLTKKLSIQKTVEFDQPQGKVVWKTINSKGLIGLDEFSVDKVQSLLNLHGNNSPSPVGRNNMIE
ncbi:MAG: tetratricopeptide repeat protein [Epsilonproteobacteria bacterium]|nr:tetratricopeptide repeat protein [Campylobacterota bacterium]